MADNQDLTQPSFATENDQLDTYRRLSRLAICSIPLGLLSALSLVSPLMWCVPMVAIMLALGGLWQVSRSKETTGRRLALLGLGLAILFGTWGMTWTLSRRMVFNHQAKKHASTWFVLMQNGEYMKAHQLGMSHNERLPPGLSLEEHYEENAATGSDNLDENDDGLDEFDEPPDIVAKTQTPFRELEAFKENGIPQILVDVDGDFEFAFVRNKTQLRDRHSATRVFQVFHLVFPQDHDPQEMDVRIELKRTIEDQKAYWQVGPTADENESS